MVISEQEQTLKWSPSQKYDTGLLTSIALDNQGNCLETHVGSVNLYYRVGKLNVADKTVAWSPSQQYDTGSLTSIALDNQGNCLETHVGAGNLYYRVGKLNVADKTVAWSPSQQYDTGSLTSIALDNQGNCLETHVGSVNLYYRVGKLNVADKTVAWSPSQQYDTGSLTSIALDNQGNCLETHVGSVNLYYRVGKLNVADKTVAWSPSQQYDTGSLTSIALDNQGNCLETHVGSVNLYYRVGKLNVTDKTVAWSPSQQYDTGSLTNIALDNQGNCLETHVGSGNLYYRISIIEISYKELGPAGSSIEGKTFSSIQPKVEASKSRIKSIRVNAGWAINKIQVQYENTAASPPEIYDSPAFGREGGTLSEFRLEAGDYLTGVSGSWGAGSPGHPKTEIITLQFHTHKGIKSQEFGGGNPQKQVEPFSLVAPEGWEIVGFFGACGDPDNCLARLGVYSTTPVTAAPLAAVKPEKLQPGIPSMAQVPQSVLEFDGQNNCVNLGKKPTFKIEKNITIEAWIYATTEQKEWTGIVSNIFDTGATESGYGLLFNGKTGIYFGLKIPSQGIEYLSSGANSLKLNEWNHIAGTYDGQQLKVYVNGVEKASKALPSNNIHYNPEKDLLIGMYRDDDEAYPFKGQIAEVRLWNCVRSATELQRDMRQTLAGNEPGLVGYWPLNEGTGTTVQDKTNNANQGTITGSPTWVKAEIPIEVKQQPAPPNLQPVLNFDGQDDFVELAAKSIPSGSEITVNFWSYGGSLSPKHSSIIAAKGPNNERILNIHLPWGESKIYFDSGNQASGFDRIEKVAQASDYKEKWSHWAFTKNVTTGEMKIYLNGELWHSGTGKTMPLIPATRVTLGCFSNSQLYHHGMISELQIWNKVRSQDEIKADMARRLVGDEPGLVGYWPLNEGTGTTVQDKTKNANHGTISGNATWVQAEIPIEVKQQPVIASPPNLQPVLNFDGQDDFVELAAKSIPSGSEITVNFWSYGGSLSPKHSSIIAAKGPNNERILNIHLPWGESKIYFDSGNQASGFDRIDKVAQASDYKEKWSHWAFTKNVTTGEMKIYLNGELWHSGTGKNMPLIPATRVTLGCFSNSQLYHHGMISELQIWNKARSQDEIKADMARRLVGNEPGLVGYWPLNEGTGTTVQDKTKNANHGTISGNATWVQAEIPIEVKQQPVIASPPNLQPVLNFDGQNDYITCPGAIVANSYTKEAWVKLAEPLSANNVLSGHHHALFMPNGLLAAGHNGQWWFVKDSSTSPANTWLHVAVTYDSQTKVMCLYRDGRLVSQASDVPPFTPSDHALLIGSHLSSSLFRGQISEARVWNKALSQTEIQSNLSHRLVGNEPGLVGYWPLNEGTGTTVQDKTNNGNHGTISGNAVWVQAEIPIEVKQSQPPTAPQEQPQQYIQPEVSVVTQEQPQPDIQPEVAVVTQEQPQPDIQPEAPVVTQEQPQPDIQPEAPVVTQEQPQPDIQPVTPVMTEEQSQADIQPEAPVVAQEQPQPDIQGQPLVIIKEHSESAIVKQPQEQPKKRSYPYRILSIDGGGIRGIIPAMILAEIERRTGKPISSMFDLFAGTSTGGILALGLTKPKPNPNAPAYSEGVPEPAYSAQALVSMFAKYGSEIFYEPIIEELLGNLDDIIKPKYTSEGREDVLKRFFDFTPLQETLKEVFITSYDIELRTPVFFTSNPKKQNTQSHSFRRICRGFTMKQAAMATSAAPTYFSPYRIQTSQSPSSFYNLVDGGVFANNPTSLALMEAMNNAKAAAERGEETWNIDDILVVSLGTGSLTKVYPYNEAKNWGLIGWVRPLINIILDATSQSVSCELEQLLRAPANSQKQYYRFQAYLDERLEPMDNAKAENIRMLTRVAKQIIDEREEDIEELCNELMR
uniref:ORF2 n=1 Tax=Cylindrospermum alatosporum CCALA 994 TaxID=1382619 RepID=A0A346GB31_9NOST|nr:ORF2 [Cylindrospermum alatosporum CCALA 994]